MNPSTASVKPKKRRGCFFYGCLTTSIVMILVITLGVLGIRWLVQEVESRLETNPQSIPVALNSPAEYVVLKDRLNHFAEEARQGKADAPLELTSAELTSLLVSYPGYEFLAKRLGVKIESDGFHLIGSIAAADVAPMLFSHGYLNMDALFVVKVTEGRALSDLKQLIINGQVIPAQELDRLKGESSTQKFSESFDSDEIPEVKSFVNSVERIETLPGKVVIYPKHGAAVAAPAPSVQASI